MNTDQPAAAKPQLRWFYPTPGRLLVVLLVVEGILLLSERFQWFAFNEQKGYTVLIAIASIGVTMLFMFLWFVVALLFHLHFQFSIRSLLLLTVAVAIPFSWLAVEMKWAREQKEAVEAIVKVDGSVNYDYEFDSYGSLVQRATPAGPAWLRKLLGDDYFRNTTFVTIPGEKVTNADLEHLKELKQVQMLDLQISKITDAGLEQLKGMKQLQSLELSKTQFTDAGCQHLIGMNKLQTLILDGTLITDAGLKHLKGMIQLQNLSLVGTKVTDNGLEKLKELKQLQLLDLRRTKVTDAGVEKLQKALPNLRIDHP
jgi:hypothetical protein